MLGRILWVLSSSFLPRVLYYQCGEFGISRLGRLELKGASPFVWPIEKGDGAIYDTGWRRSCANKVNMWILDILHSREVGGNSVSVSGGFSNCHHHWIFSFFRKSWIKANYGESNQLPFNPTKEKRLDIGDDWSSGRNCSSKGRGEFTIYVRCAGLYWYDNLANLIRLVHIVG